MKEVKTKADISRVGIDEDLGIWIVPKRGKWIYINPDYASDIIYQYLKIKHKKESKDSSL